MTSLTHFYHVYADGDWEEPLGDHLHTLRESELISNLDNFFVGIVGKVANRAKVKKMLGFAPIVAASEGWEQVTLRRLHGYAKKNDDKIFYAHTKGAWSRSQEANAWRASMTHYTVTRWRKCVDLLQNYDVVGPYWLKSNHEAHAEHDYFFGGNFWWANAKYIRTLPALRNENRWQAEGWIGLNRPNAYNMRKGIPVEDNFWRNREST